MTFKYSGIDISKWQNPSSIHWAQIKQDHQFVIIRACYGVKSDWAFEAHFDDAKDAGIKHVGAYTFYRQAQGWKEQYEAFKGKLDQVGFGEGDILPVVDMEWNEKYDGKVNPAKFNQECRALVEELAKTYGGCILYLAPGFYETLGKPLWMLEYPWWIAHYNVAKPWCPWKKWAIWQYTGKGKTAGYSGATIDLNWADELPPVVDLIPDIEDHEIPDIAEHEPYGDIEDPYELVVISAVPGTDTPAASLKYDPLAVDEDVFPIRPDQPTVPDAPIARSRGWIQCFIDWLKLWIFSRNGK
jgi:GH25 family lysozyme M1 (1,4-beta-N-acetylmuramidase)